MTKIIILGEEPKRKKRKTIQFLKCLMDDCNSWNDGDPGDHLGEPKDFEVIELVCGQTKSEHQYDIMFAYCKHRSKGVLYIGHFNDGVV